MSSRETWRCRAVSRVVLRLGTRGILGRHPEGFSRFGHSRHVALSEGSRGRFPRFGLSGRVAHSHGIRRVALGVGFRDTWHAPKENPKGSLGMAFGTRGTLRRKIRRGSFGVAFRT